MNLDKLYLTLTLSALLPWAAVAVAALIVPRLTRPDLFFSVTVNPSFRDSETGRRIIREYRIRILLFSIIALIPVFSFVFSRRFLVLALTGPIVIEIAGTFVAFLAARRKAIEHHVQPTTEREAELTPRRVSIPGGVLAIAGPFLILAAVALCLAWHWDRLPDRFPIHWGLDGKPNRWTTKGVGPVYGTLIVAGSFFAMLTVVLCTISRSVRRIRSGAAGNENRFVRATLSYILATEYWLAFMFGSLALIPLRGNPYHFPPIWLILGGHILLLIAIFWLAYRMGQGGTRLDKPQKAVGPDARPVGDRTPDDCWKLGVIYFNRNDPAVWVEKRFGVGWTMNFAQPAAWVVLGALMLFSVGGLVFALVTAHNR